MRAADPYVELLLIFDSGVPARRIERRLAGLSGTVDGVAPHWSSVDRRLVAAAHARQLFVRTYTVNDEAQVARLAAMGVDGIVTDAPDRAQAALAAGERVAA
jgi:glycerophosphoryl diester phosphodiesterase